MKLFSSKLTKLALCGAGIYGLLRLLRGRNAMDFRGRVVAITGGSRGLGLAMAREWANQGAKLALIANNEDELKRAEEIIAAHGVPVISIVCDVTQKDQITAAIDQVAAHFGALDVLVNNAGIIQVGPLENMDEDDFRRTVDLHLWAPFYGMNAAIPHLKKAGGGRIVNIASFAGKVAVPHMAPYVTSKFALVGLSNAMRNELAKDDILVTTVCPGVMRTGSHVAAKFKGQQAKEYQAFKLMASLPIGVTSAPAAAQKIIEATKFGDPDLTFPLSIKLATIGSRAFPNLAALFLVIGAQLMPAPEPEHGDQTLSGAELETEHSPFTFTRLPDQAAAQHNEL